MASIWRIPFSLHFGADENEFATSRPTLTRNVDKQRGPGNGERLLQRYVSR